MFRLLEIRNDIWQEHTYARYLTEEHGFRNHRGILLPGLAEGQELHLVCYTPSVALTLSQDTLQQNGGMDWLNVTAILRFTKSEDDSNPAHIVQQKAKVVAFDLPRTVLVDGSRLATVLDTDIGLLRRYKSSYELFVKHVTTDNDARLVMLYNVSEKYKEADFVVFQREGVPMMVNYEELTRRYRVKAPRVVEGLFFNRKEYLTMPQPIIEQHEMFVADLRLL
ncbi:hypothetical protein SPFM12_00103 [Salmonella phage SPFM12]|nr:hypothetical protein SPFM12_00103 [Salmonella phage SPFM12]